MPEPIHPPRTPWCNFPDVLIHASESAVKQHPASGQAKSGDDEAAAQLVMDTFNIEKHWRWMRLPRTGHRRWSANLETAVDRSFIFISAEDHSIFQLRSRSPAG
jgi:hypothetical protein